MPRTCLVCIHPDRQQIEADLVSGHGSLNTFAAKWHVSADSLGRHQTNHLPASLAQAQGAGDLAHKDALLSKVQTLQNRAESLLTTAEQANDVRGAASLIRELRGVLELQAKMLGHLMPDQVHLHKHEPAQADDRELIAFLLRELCPGCREKLAAHYESAEPRTLDGRGYVS